METSIAKSYNCKIIKMESIINLSVYDKLINWVIGEFDLYLLNESDILKVYFPSGWFSIRGFENENKDVTLKIIIKGKSKTACEEMMNKLQSIYNHVINFYGNTK